MHEDYRVAKVHSALQADTQELNERHRLIQAISFLNKAELQILGESNRVEFSIDSASSRLVVKVVRADTKDVIYQMPPEYALELARNVRQNGR